MTKFHHSLRNKGVDTKLSCESKTILNAVHNLSYPLRTSILYLEADINYTIFHLIDGKKIISSFTLKKYEQKQELGAFLRVSKSYLLNPDFIKNCQKEDNKTSVELSNGRIVQVSRRKVGLVRGLIVPNI